MTGLAHPLDRLAQELTRVVRVRDVKQMTRWLCGAGLPRVDREPTEPYQTLWLAIERLAPPPEWFDQLAMVVEAQLEMAARACGAIEQALPRAVGDHGHDRAACVPDWLPTIDQGDTVSEGFFFNLFAFCDCLPRHPRYFDWLNRLAQPEHLGRYAGSIRVGEAMQSAVVAQQSDDRLMARWRDGFLGIVRALETQGTAAAQRQALPFLRGYWRAMLLAPPAQSLDGSPDDYCRGELLQALTAFSAVRLDPEDRDDVLRALLEQAQAILYGDDVYWRAEWGAPGVPDAVRAVAADLWPDEDAPDSLLAEDARLLRIWRTLDMAQRSEIRQAWKDHDGAAWNRLRFSVVQKGDQKLREVLAHLTRHDPAFRSHSPTHDEVRNLADESGRAGVSASRHDEATIVAHPENVVARNGLANVHHALGEYAKAKELYEATIAAHPEDVVARNGLANALRKLGDPERARATLGDWSARVGRQRIVDGVVAALIEVQAGCSATAQAILNDLLATPDLPAAERVRLHGLATAMALRELRLEDARERLATIEREVATPPVAVDYLRWHAAVLSRDMAAADESRAHIEAGGGSARGSQFAALMVRVLSPLPDQAANDAIFDFEADLLLAA